MQTKLSNQRVLTQTYHCYKIKTILYYSTTNKHLSKMDTYNVYFGFVVEGLAVGLVDGAGVGPAEGRTGLTDVEGVVVGFLLLLLLLEEEGEVEKGLAVEAMDLLSAVPLWGAEEGEWEGFLDLAGTDEGEEDRELVGDSGVVEVDSCVGAWEGFLDLAGMDGPEELCEAVGLEEGVGSAVGSVVGFLDLVALAVGMADTSEEGTAV